MYKSEHAPNSPHASIDGDRVSKRQIVELRVTQIDSGLYSYVVVLSDYLIFDQGGFSSESVNI
jgi:hypothetical protein